VAANVGRKGNLPRTKFLIRH